MNKAQILASIWHEYASTVYHLGIRWSVASAGIGATVPDRNAHPVPGDLIPGIDINYVGQRALFGHDPLAKPLIPSAYLSSRTFQSHTVSERSSLRDAVSSPIAESVSVGIEKLLVSYRTSDSPNRDDYYALHCYDPDALDMPPSVAKFAGVVMALVHGTVRQLQPEPPMAPIRGI